MNNVAFLAVLQILTTMLVLREILALRDAVAHLRAELAALHPTIVLAAE